VQLVRPGAPFPLGAHPVDGGTSFAVASRVAHRVELCLVDEVGTEQRVELTEQTFGVWHGVVSDVGPGQRYGYRVHGPWDPQAGLRCNPRKLLLDPYARRITGALGDADALLAHHGHPFDGPSLVDSLGHVPLSVVVAPGGPDTGTRPDVPWAETVLYELHVGSFTAAHPDVPDELRGSYLGLAHPAVVAHLVELGVTTVELLPVQAFLDEPPVRARGMRNHWGYSTAAYLAPHPGYASVPGQEVAEFRTMVGALHAAGIEVVLDVVHNHTCEGGVDGPSLSLRGLDAPGYYLHGRSGHLLDLTGCGNTLDPASPDAVRLVLDSLRYWAVEMGVDGFRFDLASALGRPRGGDFDPRAVLLTAIATDPVLSVRKLVAEPWDATGAGYQVGGFGPAWTEWNDHFRDTVRDFWRGSAGVRELASRLSGSSDLYSGGGRRPWASVNFVTAHDGFTLRDLVSYAHKHNDANGEHNRDGTGENRSENHGVEGESAHPVVQAARARHVRALLATLLLSTGTPMLLAGDELGTTQGGNNNAYCAPADDPRAWALDWAGADTALLGFTRRVVALRRACPALRQPEFFEGRATPSGEPDLVWFGQDGAEIADAAWHDEDARTLQVWVDGSDVRSLDRAGHQLGDSSWVLVLHSGSGAELTLPAVGELELVLDTGTPTGEPDGPVRFSGGDVVELAGCTFWLLRVL
jgi:isoamylase